MLLDPQVNGHLTYLSDMNTELITAYQTIQARPIKVLHKLQKFKNTEEDYYKIREMESRGPITQTARFIYLNQASYNGLYRVNKKGKYNVPYGFRKSFLVDDEKYIKC